MARIPRGKKHRAISWRIEGANRRRDFRQTCGEQEVAPHRSCKDTRRWCRGVVGREHRYVWFLVEPSVFRYWIRACEECGKHCYK